MRLFISYKYSIVHINEYLYIEIETDTRKSGEKQFDYVNPKNREVQIEMEAACTEYLKCIDAYFMPTSSRPVNLHSENFEFEASVIIPVRNRAHTIRDAVNSALNQRTTFSFNIIVIDNHSTDVYCNFLGTVGVINIWFSCHITLLQSRIVIIQLFHRVFLYKL